MVIVFFKMHQEILPSVFCPDPSWSASSVGGEYEKEATLRIVVPTQTQTSSNSFSINYRLYICHEHSECSVKDLHFVVNVLCAENAPTTTVHYLTHVVELQQMGSSTHNLSS
jgi:hypothetical protein